MQGSKLLFEIKFNLPGLKMDENFYLYKIKGARSDRSFRRFKKEFLDQKISEKLEIDSSSQIQANQLLLTNQIDNEIEDEIDYEIKEFISPQDELNTDQLFNDMKYCVANEQNDLENEESFSSSESDDNDEQSDVDLMISQMLIDFKLRFHIKDDAMNSYLKMTNTISKIKTNTEIVPKSIYLLKKNIEYGPESLKAKIGFRCLKCDQNILVDEDKTTCSNCSMQLDKRKVLNGNHFIVFDLETQLKIMLETIPLKEVIQNRDNIISSIFDGDVYKEYCQLNTDRKIIIIILFSDGVQISRSSLNQLWPIFIKICDLDCDEVNKTFLLASFFGDSKPDVDFYLESIIKTLNRLFVDGIYIEKLCMKVYPMLIANVFDLPAKSHFLGHVGHLGYYFCIICLIRGQRCGNCQIFKPEKVDLRNYNEYDDILKNKLPHYGVKSRSPLSKIEYLNIWKSSPVDAMHCAVAGIGKRLFNCFIDSNFRDKPCFINLELSNVLHRRLACFGATSDFKRFPRDLNVIHFWKTSEYMQFILYESPIVLESLIDEKAYKHWLLFVYILGKLWNGNLKRDDLNTIDELINLFVNDIDTIYSEKEHTPNMHLLLHLVACVTWFGPLKEFNAFLYEHLNGVLKKYVRSPYALNRQVCNEYRLDFITKLKNFNFSKQEKKN